MLSPPKDPKDIESEVEITLQSRKEKLAKLQEISRRIVESRATVAEEPDERICTHFPSRLDMLEEFIEKLKKSLKTAWSNVFNRKPVDAVKLAALDEALRLLNKDFEKASYDSQTLQDIITRNDRSVASLHQPSFIRQPQSPELYSRRSLPHFSESKFQQESAKWKDELANNYPHQPPLDSTFQESPMRPVPSNFRTGQHTHNNDHTVRSRQEGLQKSGLPRWRPGQTPVTGPTTGQHSMIGRINHDSRHPVSEPDGAQEMRENPYLPYRNRGNFPPSRPSANETQSLSRHPHDSELEGFECAVVPQESLPPPPRSHRFPPPNFTNQAADTARGHTGAGPHNSQYPTGVRPIHTTRPFSGLQIFGQNIDPSLLDVSLSSSSSSRSGNTERYHMFNPAAQANRSSQGHPTSLRGGHNPLNLSVSSSRTFGNGNGSDKDENEVAADLDWTDHDDIYD
ncbi:hypothetical protein CVT25_013672 [Psilocybe cyanescens]|uniref:Uncharacterized protein n=1 Tax=Psilocybe cyanescens TaxID=93625 RepID=A0A409WTC6_PSICY|nr:hypothetical protein CVT25_013672 [Psilocybe cyanescens]